MELVDDMAERIRDGQRTSSYLHWDVVSMASQPITRDLIDRMIGRACAGEQVNISAGSVRYYLPDMDAWH